MYVSTDLVARANPTPKRSRRCRMTMMRSVVVVVFVSLCTQTNNIYTECRISLTLHHQHATSTSISLSRTVYTQQLLPGLSLNILIYICLALFLYVPIALILLYIWRYTRRRQQQRASNIHNNDDISYFALSVTPRSSRSIVYRAPALFPSRGPPSRPRTDLHTAKAKGSYIIYNIILDEISEKYDESKDGYINF